MATFGEKLKAVRLSRDMSQDDIAKILNTTKQSISRYETETNSPRLDTVADIADKLGIELSLFINDKYSVEDVLNYRKSVLLEERSDMYYVDQDARLAANEIFKNPDMRLLFNAARDVSADDLRSVAAILESLKRKERGDERE